MTLIPPPGWEPRRSSRRLLVLPAILLALLVGMPWLLKYIEEQLPREYGHFSETMNSMITLLLGLWILSMIRREHHLTHRHLEQLEQLSLTDPLTGLGNRRAFERYLEIAVERARRQDLPLALLYLDIDDMKRVNDHFGHALGDEALRSLAAVLRSSSRIGSDAAYRVGGDEFVMVISADAAGADSIAERVRQRFAERSPRGAQVTGGVVVWDRTQRIQELLDEADTRMYRRKMVNWGAAPV